MSQKQYLVCRLVITFFLAALIGASITQENFVLPIIAIITAMAVMYYCKKKVKDVLVDERDIKIWYKASRMSVTIFAVLAAIGSIILVALGKDRPEFLLVGYTLSYSVCFLLILNSVLYKIYNKKGE